MQDVAECLAEAEAPWAPRDLAAAFAAAAALEVRSLAGGYQAIDSNWFNKQMNRPDWIIPNELDAWMHGCKKKDA